MPNKIAGLFITGTDTGCGKTTVTVSIMQLLQDCGYSVVGMKPVATDGGIQSNGDSSNYTFYTSYTSTNYTSINQKCYNSDALQIQQAGSVVVPYELINPYVFSPPIAPHLAAKEVGIEISREKILSSFAVLRTYADIVIVEGVGGWLVPLGAGFAVADLPLLLEIPVLLVVGLRLGCINHVLLTVDSIINRGCNFSGWVANQIESQMLRQQQVIDTLVDLIPAPYLGQIPYISGGANAPKISTNWDNRRIIELFATQLSS